MARGIKDRDLENVFHFLEALRNPQGRNYKY